MGWSQRCGSRCCAGRPTPRVFTWCQRIPHVCGFFRTTFLCSGRRELRRREGGVGRVSRVPPAPFLCRPGRRGPWGSGDLMELLCRTRVPPPTRGRSMVAGIRTRGLWSRCLQSLGPAAQSPLPHPTAPHRTLPHPSARRHPAAPRSALQSSAGRTESTQRPACLVRGAAGGRPVTVAITRGGPATAPPGPSCFSR